MVLNMMHVAVERREGTVHASDIEREQSGLIRQQAHPHTPTSTEPATSRSDQWLSNLEVVLGVIQQEPDDPLRSYCGVEELGAAIIDPIEDLNIHLTLENQIH